MSHAKEPGRHNEREDAFESARRDERKRVGLDIAGRLEERGVTLTGTESSDDLVTLLEALEAFERAVQAKGGDLMVDERRDTANVQPDDVHFALPPRAADESVAQYVRRLREATVTVDEHPPLPGG
ncbi:MAG: hypothetical protein ACT4PJ_00245 [Gemmatimonadaceae bacterium]